MPFYFDLYYITNSSVTQLFFYISAIFFIFGSGGGAIFAPPLYDLVAAAAAEEDDGDDNEPNSVILEEGANAVIHHCSYFLSCRWSGFTVPRYHIMLLRGGCECFLSDSGDLLLTGKRSVKNFFHICFFSSMILELFPLCSAVLTILDEDFCPWGKNRINYIL